MAELIRAERRRHLILHNGVQVGSVTKFGVHLYGVFWWWHGSERKPNKIRGFPSVTVSRLAHVPALVDHLLESDTAMHEYKGCCTWHHVNCPYCH